MYHSSIRRCSRVPCTFSPLNATAPRGVNEQKDDKRIGRGIINSARLHQMQRLRVPAIRQMHHLHPRYNKKGKPFEKCFYFPLRPRIKALLGLASFRLKLQHEHRRLSNPQLMSDVYDSPAWKKKMGPCTEKLSRIGFQYCADGIPPCSEGKRDTDRPGHTNRYTTHHHHSPVVCLREQGTMLRL